MHSAFYKTITPMLFLRQFAGFTYTFCLQTLAVIVKKLPHAQFAAVL